MKLAVAGITGRMGRAIAEVAQGNGDIDLLGLCRPGQLETAQAALPATEITFTDAIDDIAGADALIEFTQPNYSLELAALAADKAIPLVSGTTGYSDDEFAQLQAYAKQIPIFWASNMSVGVALLMQLVTRAAAQLPDEYDIEVLEMHHRHKVDAPSGTALSLGKAAAKGRGIDLETHAVLSREGQMAARKRGDIGFATLRGGSVIGEHSVIFAGEMDVFELTHRSQSRNIYAQGAMRAATWLQGKKPGFYGMEELLAD